MLVFVDRIKLFFQKRKKVLLIALIGILLVSLAYSLFGPKNSQPQYQTTAVTRGTLVNSVSASGAVVSTNIMEVNSQASGIVDEVYVQNGDLVEAGDKLFEIQLDQNGQQRHNQDWASYLSAKNSLESAKINEYTLQADMFGKWDSFKELAENSTYQNDDGTPNYTNRALPEFHIPEKEWLAAEAKYKNQAEVVAQAQANLSSAWNSYQLSSSTVTAPIAGTIEGLAVAPGMVISNTSNNASGSTTATISSNTLAYISNTKSKPIVSVNLSEIDVSKVKTGQKAIVTIDSLPNNTFAGHVIAVNRVGTVSSNVTQYPALVALELDSDLILPNMAATANIIVKTKTDALIIPSSAVTYDGSQASVKVLQKKQPITTYIETGISSATEIEVVSGLNEGDLVVISIASTNENTTNPFNNMKTGTGMMRIAR